MEEVFEECNIRTTFMEKKTMRAMIVIGYVVKENFGQLLKVEIPHIPKVMQKNADSLGEHVSPELWIECVFHDESIEILNSLSELGSVDLREFVMLFPNDFPLAHRIIVYLITYSQRDPKKIRELSRLQLPRMVIKKIQSFYAQKKKFDPKAIHFIYHMLAKNN